MDFNIFGIPMVGADICGYVGNTTVELCARWQELGAFYPFSRNHNSMESIPQDPTSLGDVVVRATKKSLLDRYRLHNLLYTLFYEANTKGFPVIRSMFTLDPTDQIALSIQTQFLWGNSLLVLPVLDQGATSVKAYFTPGIWYDFEDYSIISNFEVGQYVNLSAPLETIRLAVRGGSVLALQKPEVTIIETRRNPIEIVAFLDNSNQAYGKLFWDDGITLDTVQYKQYNLYEFDVSDVS